MATAPTASLQEAAQTSLPDARHPARGPSRCVRLNAPCLKTPGPGFALALYPTAHPDYTTSSAGVKWNSEKNWYREGTSYPPEEDLLSGEDLVEAAEGVCGKPGAGGHMRRQSQS